MKFALNIKKGTIVNHPYIGKIIGGQAIEVTEHEANQLKNIINIIIFDEVKMKKEIK